MDRADTEAAPALASASPAMPDGPWHPLTVNEIRSRFQDAGIDWWLAGGIAIDCFLGWETRHHEDLDVEMLRSDRDQLFDVFDGWDLHSVSQGVMTPWRRGDAIADDVFGIWGRPDPRSRWAVEVLLAGGDNRVWRFRRDPTITMPRTRLVRNTADDVPYCTPEVQLLYKARKSRPKDDVDLARCLHRMSTEQKRWLSDALGRFDPSHPWNEVVASASRLNDESG